MADRPARAARGAPVAALMFLTAFAMAVGNPIAWLWIGSLVADTRAPQAGAYVLVAAGIIGGLMVLSRVLEALSHVYNKAVGVPAVTERAAAEPWHVSQRRDPGHRMMTAALMATIIPALCGAAIWFLFYAKSPLPS